MTNHYQRALDAIEHMNREETAQVAVVALGHLPRAQAIEAIFATLGEDDLDELAARLDERKAHPSEWTGGRP